MEHLIENKNCYAFKVQRDILLKLITNQCIEKSFFLTGGSALSIFYLHHRISNDLDFFTLEKIDLSEIDFWIKSIFPNDNVKIKKSPNFLSLLIKETKVDFVIDTLSNKEKKKSFLFENGHYLAIDTINNIVSNKLCAIVSRVEPKDYIDLYFIFKSFPNIKIEDVYNNARKKDAIFDDPPTAAFQIEEGLAFIKENSQIHPKVLKDFDIQDFSRFHKNIADWLYKKFFNPYKKKHTS